MIDYLVLGAGGVIGQHLFVTKDDRDAKFVRRTASEHFLGVDLSWHHDVMAMLEKYRPKAIINLAGENRVDVVEGSTGTQNIAGVNTGLPLWLAAWADNNGSHLIQASTQAVFNGEEGPYSPASTPRPYLTYGFQKFEAERLVQMHKQWTIARITFVLGVRPLPNMGRVNPLEMMFDQDEQRQVNDRWMSVSFAKDVAAELWNLAETTPGGILHLGIPERVSRYDLAKIANPTAKITPVSDNEFTGPRRPLDTTWAPGSLYRTSVEEGIEDARKDWKNRAL